MCSPPGSRRASRSCASWPRRSSASSGSVGRLAIVRLDLDAALSLAPLGRAGDDGMDRWDGSHWVRAVPPGFVATVVDGGFDVRPPHARGDVAAAFTPATPALEALRATDPVIDTLAARYPGLRQVLLRDLMGALLRAISAQQITLRFAATLRRRVAETFGEPVVIDGHQAWHLDAAALCEATVERLRDLQWSTAKARSLIAGAHAVAAGLTIDELDRMADDEVVATLVALPGIGLWSAEWILVRSLARPRVVAGDLAVRKAVGLAYLDDPRPTELAVRRATEHWGDAAHVAQALLLQAWSDNLLSAAGPPRLARRAP